MIPIYPGRRVDIDHSGRALRVVTRLPLTDAHLGRRALVKARIDGLTDWHDVCAGLGLEPMGAPTVLVTHGTTGELRINGEVTPAP